MVNIFAVDIYTWSFKNSKTKAILAEREIIRYTISMFSIYVTLWVKILKSIHISFILTAIYREGLRTETKALEADLQSFLRVILEFLRWWCKWISPTKNSQIKEYSGYRRGYRKHHRYPRNHNEYVTVCKILRT